jgi:hypothetical protein
MGKTKADKVNKGNEQCKKLINKINRIGKDTKKLVKDLPLIPLTDQTALRRKVITSIVDDYLKQFVGRENMFKFIQNMSPLQESELDKHKLHHLSNQFIKGNEHMSAQKLKPFGQDHDTIFNSLSFQYSRNAKKYEKEFQVATFLAQISLLKDEIEQGTNALELQNLLHQTLATINSDKAASRIPNRFQCQAIALLTNRQINVMHPMFTGKDTADGPLQTLQRKDLVGSYKPADNLNDEQDNLSLNFMLTKSTSKRQQLENNAIYWRPDTVVSLFGNPSLSDTRAKDSEIVKNNPDIGSGGDSVPCRSFTNKDNMDNTQEMEKISTTGALNNNATARNTIDNYSITGNDGLFVRPAIPDISLANDRNKVKTAKVNLFKGNLKSALNQELDNNTIYCQLENEQGREVAEKYRTNLDLYNISGDCTDNILNFITSNENIPEEVSLPAYFLATNAVAKYGHLLGTTPEILPESSLSQKRIATDIYADNLWTAMDKEKEMEDYYAAKVKPDGNCLLNAISMAAYGNERQETIEHLRHCIFREMITNGNFYLNDEELSNIGNNEAGSYLS